MAKKRPIYIDDKSNSVSLSAKIGSMNEYIK